MLRKLIPLLLMFLLCTAPALAAQPVVHAVLFFSPTCGHCHEVMTNDLPPLQEKYGSQLDIYLVDVSTEEGRTLYNTYLAEYDSKTTPGVPALLVGSSAMVGSVDIPDLFPGLIEAGIQAGGVDFPKLSGLAEYRKSHPSTPLEDVPSPEEAEAALFLQPTPVPASQIPTSTTARFVQMFQRDVVGNSIAVIVLLGMLVSIIWIGYIFLKPADEDKLPAAPRYPWLVPLLCVAGLFVAGYMTYVEVRHVQAVCGPVGDCNSVQQSPYATLFGFLPVGVFGLIGYVAILAAWLVWRFVHSPIQKWAGFAMWGMAVFGVLFSIYLTFLEPFVIGATCIWCISSALLVTALLWVTTPIATYAMSDVPGE